MSSCDAAVKRSAAHAEAVEKRLSVPMLAVAALVIPALVLENSAARAPWPGIAATLNWVIWVAFAAELVVLLRVAPDRARWLRAHPLAVAIVILTPPFGPAAIQSARALRLLRLLRLARLATLTRSVFTLDGLRWVAALTLLLLIGGGAAFAAAEHGHHNPALSSWDGIWWAFITVTTVGYGDITPVTTVGRIIGIVIAATGIGFVALLTAAAATRFAHRREDAAASAQTELLAELRSISARLDRLEQR